MVVEYALQAANLQGISMYAPQGLLRCMTIFIIYTNITSSEYTIYSEDVITVLRISIDWRAPVSESAFDVGWLASELLFPYPGCMFHLYQFLRQSPDLQMFLYR